MGRTCSYDFYCYQCHPGKDVAVKWTIKEDDLQSSFDSLGRSVSEVTMYNHRGHQAGIKNIKIGEVTADE